MVLIMLPGADCRGIELVPSRKLKAPSRKTSFLCTNFLIYLMVPEFRTIVARYYQKHTAVELVVPMSSKTRSHADAAEG